jgi:hypothetical protein
VTDDGRAFRSTRDAEICVCGLARGDHRRSGKYAGMTKSDQSLCLAFRTWNPTIPNAAHFREVCEHPEKFGGFKWKARASADVSTDS